MLTCCVVCVIALKYLVLCCYAISRMPKWLRRHTCCHDRASRYTAGCSQRCCAVAPTTCCSAARLFSPHNIVWSLLDGASGAVATMWMSVRVLPMQRQGARTQQCMRWLLLAPARRASAYGALPYSCVRVTKSDHDEYGLDAATTPHQGAATSTAYEAQSETQSDTCIDPAATPSLELVDYSNYYSSSCSEALLLNQQARHRLWRQRTCTCNQYTRPRSYSLAVRPAVRTAHAAQPALYHQQQRDSTASAKPPVLCAACVPTLRWP